MSVKQEKLAAITARLNKEAKKNNPDREDPVAFVAAGNEALLDLGVIPTGNPAIDPVIGGGMCRGTIVMFTGPEGTGKSRLSFDAIAYNQAKDPEFVAVYCHLEARAFPLQAALEAGVDLERLIVINAQSSGEKTLDLLVSYLFDWDKMLPLDLADLIVIDSVAAAAPEAELKAVREEGFAKDTVGRQAAMMSKVLRDLSGCGSLGRACLLLINQIRVNISSYGAPESSPGGRSIGHYPKVTIRLRKGEPIKEGDQQIGHEIIGTVVKNNSGRGVPQATFSYRVVYGVGVDRLGPLVDQAVAKGVIEQTSSSVYQITRDGKTAKIRGRKTVLQLLRDDPELLVWVEGQVAA